MPHIHTEPGQHDITASAWIIRIVDDKPKVLVHMHRKHGKLMQLGGHVEIDETPWQTLAHELIEEGGYDINELEILQPSDSIPKIRRATVHPLPALSNTHKISSDPDHYHSDYGYAFVAENVPSQLPADGESQDLRWLTIDELRQAVSDGIAWDDVLDMYEFIVSECFPHYHKVATSHFSLEKT